MHPVPERYRPALEALAALADHDRYLAAVVFGSVALGETNARSDLDAHVVLDHDNPCGNVNRPTVGGVRLDITFRSLSQIRCQTRDELGAGRRPPRMAGALVVFDKTGELAGLAADAAARTSPPKPDEAPWDRFMLQHSDDKVRGSLRADPDSALYSMHACIGDVLDVHYRRNGRFRVSSKKLLADLGEWDASLAAILRRFVSALGAGEKFALWTEIVDHVSDPLGGRAALADVRCDCAVCRADLAALEAVS